MPLPTLDEERDIYGSEMAKSSSPTSDNFTSSSTTAPHGQLSPSAPSPRTSQMAKEKLSLNTDYQGPVIPPSTKERRKNRTIVLCFDGTGDQFDNDNSNVVQFFSLLKKGDSKQQLTYYQAGIGTYTIPQIASPLESRLKRLKDMMFGSSLHYHVMGGYEFLMENYRHGDRICIFGFSRGAYTARALAGMIEKVGLLPAGNHQQVPFAYKMYIKDDDEGWTQSLLFKRTFSMAIPIEFVGVWDTVDSVGIFPKHVPFTKLCTCIKTFRHAVSLDEHRVKFKANLFDKAVTQDCERDFSYVAWSMRRKEAGRKVGKWVGRVREGLRKCTSGGRESESRDEVAHRRVVDLQDQFTNVTKQTDVYEVWFAGCHCDIGGGAVPNSTRSSLSRISLRWMIRQCFIANSGIQFEADRLNEVGLDPEMLYPVVLPRHPPLTHAHIIPTSTGVVDAEKPKKGKKGGVGVPNGIYTCRSCPLDTSSSHSEDEIASDGTKSDDTQKAINQINEEHEELHDIHSPMYDQLKLKWMWWILEYIPLIHRTQRHDGAHVKTISINAGRPRVLKRQDERGINVHRSVKMRMESEHLPEKYRPMLMFDVEPTWVD